MSTHVISSSTATDTRDTTETRASGLAIPDPRKEG